MGAVRRKFKDNFTMVHNEYLNDPRLGSSEMGWLTFMLSRPDNWNFSIEGLAHTHSDGKTKIITALNKLKALGYFRRIKLIDSSTGRIIDWIYEFSDEVQPEWIETEDVCETYEQPHSDFPDMENQPQSSTDKISTDIDDSDSEGAADEETKETEDQEQEFINYNNIIKAQIDYDRLCSECDKYTIDRIKDIILEVMMYRGNIIRIANKDIETEEVKELFGAIEFKHIKKIYELIQGKQIRNFKSYIRKSLFNAVRDVKIKKPNEYTSYDNETLLLYADACDNKFNNEQMVYIENRLLSIIPYCTETVDRYDVELERYEYLRTLYLRMMAENSQKTIFNKFKYFCTMLENGEYTPRTDKSAKSKKSNGSPSYDLDAIFEHALSDSLVVNSRREE